jgi:hypothetical protein
VGFHCGVALGGVIASHRKSPISARLFDLRGRLHGCPGFTLQITKSGLICRAENRSNLGEQVAKAVSLLILSASVSKSEPPMANTIKLGTILIKDGTFLPDALLFESEPCATGWRLVKDLDGYGLHRKINEVGWTFFCLAGEIKATIFGFDGQKTVRRAVKRILTSPKSEQFNCLEITRVASKRFLGVPYMSVSACSRHVQESLFLPCDKDFGELGSSEIDCRPDQSLGPAGSKGLVKGTTMQATVAPILNR